MAEPALLLADDITVAPVIRRNFGLASHTYRQFSAIVPNDTPREALTGPDLWYNVAPQIAEGSEIRVISESGSWLARLFVTFANGNQVLAHVLEYHEIEDLVPEELEDEYFVEKRGQQGWCIVQRSSGDVVQDKYSSQAKAMIGRDEYLSVLRR